MSGAVPLAEYRKLAERCDDLEAELREFKRRGGPPLSARAAELAIRFGLARREARMLEALESAKAPTSIADLMRKAHYAGHWGKSNTHVLACRIRKRLAALGAPQPAIRTKHAIGYWLTDESARLADGAYWRGT